MSLTDTIDELKKQRDDAIAREEAANDQVEEETEEVEAEAEKEPEPAEEKKEEAPAEEKKAAEPAKVEEEPQDNSAFARLRRETAAAKKRADEAEARLAKMSEKPSTDDAAPIEDSAKIKSVLDEIITERNFKLAEREFQSLEHEFGAKTPDYGAVTAEYAAALAQSIRLQNPRMSMLDVAEKTKKTLLEKAGEYARQGFNAVEELYHEAKEFGFTGASLMKKEEPAAKEVKEEKPEPDMKKVAANRARSAGMASSSGKSEGQMTKAAAADLSVAEWQALPKAEKQRLLYG